MKKVLSIILTPIFFLFFGLTLGIFHPIQVIARNIFGKNAHDKTVSLLNLILMRLLIILGTKQKFNGFTSLPKDVPLIIVSNHQSMWDIPPLIWKFRHHHPKFVAKKSLAKFIPSISYNLKYGGSVAIDRNNPEEAKEKIKTFAQEIKNNNHSVCIFPEGTRSRNGVLKPFKTGGLRSIIEEIPEALVVPVAIKNTGLIDNNGKFLKNLGVSVSYTLLKPRKVLLETIDQDFLTIHDEIKAIVEK